MHVCVLCWQLCSQFLIRFCSPTASQTLSPFPRHIQSRGRFPYFLGCLPQGLTFQSSPACQRSTPPFTLLKHSTAGQWKVAQSWLKTESSRQEAMTKNACHETMKMFYYNWCFFVMFFLVDSRALYMFDTVLFNRDKLINIFKKYFRNIKTINIKQKCHLVVPH